MSTTNFSSAFVCIHLISKIEPVGNTLVNLFSCVLTSEKRKLFAQIHKDISLGVSHNWLFTLVWIRKEKIYVWLQNNFSLQKWQKISKCL